MGLARLWGMRAWGNRVLGIRYLVGETFSKNLVGWLRDEEFGEVGVPSAGTLGLVLLDLAA